MKSERNVGLELRDDFPTCSVSAFLERIVSTALRNPPAAPAAFWIPDCTIDVDPTVANDDFAVIPNDGIARANATRMKLMSVVLFHVVSWGGSEPPLRIPPSGSLQEFSQGNPNSFRLTWYSKIQAKSAFESSLRQPSQDVQNVFAL
jgi:hypothetical protein